MSYRLSRSVQHGTQHHLRGQPSRADFRSGFALTTRCDFLGRERLLKTHARIVVKSRREYDRTRNCLFKCDFCVSDRRLRERPTITALKQANAFSERRATELPSDLRSPARFGVEVFSRSHARRGNNIFFGRVQQDREKGQAIHSASTA